MPRRLCSTSVALLFLLCLDSAHGFRKLIPTQIYLPTSITKHRVLQQTTSDIKVFEPFGKGLIKDVKEKAPFYASDFKDGFSIKSMASTFFLFYACVAPAVAFGGLLGTATNGLMGTVETVGATAIGGILYALFAGQPITIIGTTGPLLAFLKVLYDACGAMKIPFLPVYAWVGLWSSLMLFISSFFSLSNVVEYFTRFTDDIFSSLISIIFIFEAFLNMYKNFVNPTVSGVQAFVSVTVTLTTFLVANTLSKIRQTPFLNRSLRSLVADFAAFLGVLAGLFSASALSSKYSVLLPTLNVPSVLSTTSGRPWIIDIMSLPTKFKFLAFLPALMATILLFMDQNITVRLIMSKENKLRKKNGIHLDMFVVASVTALTSVLGMPWMVAATVRSLAHLRSLKEYSATDDDATKAQFTGVNEQRVSGLLIHTLIGLALIFGRGYLQKIPTAVLTGVFLYLGISSVDKTELYQRTLLFFMDKRDAPKSTSWLKVAGLAKTKLFTSIQLMLLGAMWWIKETKLGVFFPVLIGVLAPIRIALDKLNLFTKDELDSLDGEIA